MPDNDNDEGQGSRQGEKLTEILKSIYYRIIVIIPVSERGGYAGK